MGEYNNIFLKKTNEELRELYAQYLEFINTGFIKGNELSEIRDTYIERYSSNTLVMLELDLHKAIAQRWYEEYICGHNSNEELIRKIYNMPVDTIKEEMVENAETFEERSHGEWKINADGYYPYCSECLEEPTSGKMTDFCPNCGADMRKK